MTENTTHDTSRLRHDVLQKIFPASWASEYPGKPRLSRRERRNREQRRTIASEVATVFDADWLQQRGQQLQRQARRAGKAVGDTYVELSKAPLHPEPVLHDVLVSALTEVLEKVVVTTQGRTFKADGGGHVMTLNGAAQAFADVVTAGAKEAATPATEVTEDSLHTRLTFIQIDEGKAEEIYLAAQANLADAAENLAHARNKTRDAETAYTDFVNGGAK